MMKAHRKELEGIPNNQIWDNLINKINNENNELELIEENKYLWALDINK